MPSYIAQPLLSIRPLDDLPPRRLENALLMWKFLRAVWEREPGRAWYYAGRPSEQADAIDDLCAAGLVFVGSCGAGPSSCVPAQGVRR